MSLSPAAGASGARHLVKFVELSCALFRVADDGELVHTVLGRHAADPQLLQEMADVYGIFSSWQKVTNGRTRTPVFASPKSFSLRCTW